MNAWSTHQPLIRLLLQEYDPKFICELGIGHYSTPIFQAHKSEKLFIENDEEWIDKMGVDAIHHKIDVCSQDVPVSLITQSIKKGIVEYYKSLSLTILATWPMRLLFVDNYSCCRALAINTLYPVFDLIIYHDSEPQSISRNDYYFEMELFDDFDHYDLQTPSTWASMFVRKDLPEKDLIKAIEPIIREYEIESETTGIKLVKGTNKLFFFFKSFF